MNHGEILEGLKLQRLSEGADPKVWYKAKVINRIDRIYCQNREVYFKIDKSLNPDKPVFIFTGSHYNLPMWITMEDAKKCLKSERDKNGQLVPAEDQKFVEDQKEWAYSS